MNTLERCYSPRRPRVNDENDGLDGARKSGGLVDLDLLAV